MKSPWEILGIERTASVDEAKKAFKKLALKYHPDRNPGDKEAENKFKEASTAFDEIESGRANRPKNGPNVPPDMAGMDDFFRQNRQPRASARVRVRLTFKEYCLGASKSVPVTYQAQCTPCNGNGAAPGDYTVCPECNGSGARIHRHGMLTMNLGPCQACKGKGRNITKECPDCKGAGEVPFAETVGISIPAVAPPSMYFNLEGRVSIALELSVDNPTDGMSLRGDTIFSPADVSLADALFGTNIDVETLRGTKKIKVPPMEKGYIELRLRGQGAGSPAGDHIVKVTVKMPDSDADRLKIQEILAKKED